MVRFATARFLRVALVLIGLWGFALPGARAQTSPIGQGLVADTTELRVLRTLFYATDGFAWQNARYWLSGNTLTDASRWTGVRVGNGDVIGLTLPKNSLHGPLPAALGQLAALRTIDLSGNQLTGPLPAAVGNWRGITTVRLQANALTGPLPSSLGRWTKLLELDLHANQFTGSLPDSLRYCDQLERLAVNDNALSGSMQMLTRLFSLTYLNAAHNRFEGHLLPALGGLRGLTQLYLDHNGFISPIPDNFGALTNLVTLTLSSNRFSGAVPHLILQLPNLAELLLNDNDFTGISELGNSVNLPAAVNVAGNLLDYGALENLYTGPQLPRMRAVEARGQRPPPGTDTTDYRLDAPLNLVLEPARGAHSYHYQWQRLVGGQWVDLPGDTLQNRYVATATAADQGTYRRAVHNRWFTIPNLDPTELYSVLVYADMRPYAPLARNRPNDFNALEPLVPNAAPDAAAPRPAEVNYVRTWTPQVALTTLPASAPTPTTAEVAQAQVTTQYLDGLGRALQTVQHRASPLGRDLIQPIAYDAVGRTPRQYLPYADTAGTARSTAQGYHYRALTDQQAFYWRTGPVSGGMGPLPTNDPTTGVARTGRAYAETLSEAAPLNRVLAQGAAGEAWQLSAGHVVERTERPNTAADSVLRFAPAPTGADPNYRGFYAPGELWGTEVAEAHGPSEYGAHGYRTTEWTDRQGRLVLRQVEAGRERVPRAQARQGGGPGPAEAMRVNARWLRTAYAYDDFGRLRFVLQPEGTRRLLPLAAGTALPAGVAPFLFRYRYDERGRQIAKQVPGTDGETVVVYDRLDRPVMSQDPAQRPRREWLVTKYDALGRVVLTGLLLRTDTLSRAGLQALAAADTAAAQQYEVRTANGSYADFLTYDHAFPRAGHAGFAGGQPLRVTYYDDYDFDNDGQPDAAYDPRTDARFPAGQAPVPDLRRATGRVTRTKTRVLGVAENDQRQAPWLTTTTFYDERGRPIQVRGTNARNGTDLLTTQLDFQGRVVQSVALHTGPNHAPLTVAEFFTYDPAGRLLTTRQQLPGEAQPSQIASVQYNELGQATRKTMGTGRLAQPVKYAYNIRGWLTQLNNPYYPVAGDLFNLSLHYERGFTLGYEQYNGNLTGQTWRGRDGVQRAYGYVYDPLNRLRQGDFVARNAAAAATPAIPGLWTAEADNYRLSFASYDDNGNLRTLRRRGLLRNASHTTAKQYGPVDNLNYAYAGNRLQAVDDLISTNQLPRPAGYAGAPASLAGDFQEQGVHQATEYDYDANGSLTADRNKGLTSIAYNHLSLPQQIRFGAGADSIVFHYSAAGQKVTKLVYQTGQPTRRTDYLGPYQYEDDSLRFFPHAEGRVLRFVSKDAAGQPTVRYEREFTFKDHLGNLRLTYRAGQVRTLTATLEPDAPTHARESQQFDSLSVSPPVAQNVGNLARTGSYAARLNAGGPAPQPLGPLTQLPVQKGDTITVAAPGRYQQAASNHPFSLLSFIASLLQPAPAGTPPGADGSRRGGLPLLQVGLSSASLLALNQLPGGVPKAYLRVLSFNQDSVLVDQRTIQFTAAALGNYETLSTGQLIVQQDGYVSVYVGNESATDVYFDDVTIEHRQGLQVQENHYDPFGLDLAGVNATAPGLKPLNQYKFNGKEFQTDLGLNWNHQDWRFYDTQLGRWHVVDPLVEVGQESWTPYQFGYDNAVRYNDPNGQFPGLGELYNAAKNAINGLKEAVVGSIASTVVNNPGESKFAKENTVSGMRAHVNGNEAREKSDASKLPEGDGSPRNALRHGILSAMLNKALGPAMAKKATDAHEQGGANILRDRSKNVQELNRTGQTVMSNKGDLADAFVDQLNNATGRQIAGDNPQASDYQLQNMALNAMEKGNSNSYKLYIFTPIPNSTNVIVTPASLTSDVIGQARWNMNEPTAKPRLFSPLP